jgi:hypothetical protein
MKNQWQMMKARGPVVADANELGFASNNFWDAGGISIASFGDGVYSIEYRKGHAQEVMDMLARHGFHDFECEEVPEPPDAARRLGLGHPRPCY